LTSGFGIYEDDVSLRDGGNVGKMTSEKDNNAVKSKEAQKFDFQVSKLTATKVNSQGVAVEFKGREWLRPDFHSKRQAATRVCVGGRCHFKVFCSQQTKLGCITITTSECLLSNVQYQ